MAKQWLRPIWSKGSEKRVSGVNRNTILHTKFVNTVQAITVKNKVLDLREA